MALPFLTSDFLPFLYNYFFFYKTRVRNILSVDLLLSSLLEGSLKDNRTAT